MEKRLFGDIGISGRKHGVCTILYNDGSRFHGMFFNNQALGLGLTADKFGNIEWGMYKKTKLELFGMISKVKGRRYIGCFEDGLFCGPGIIEFKDKWMFGYSKKEFWIKQFLKEKGN